MRHRGSARAVPGFVRPGSAADRHSCPSPRHNLPTDQSVCCNRTASAASGNLEAVPCAIQVRVDRRGRPRVENDMRHLMFHVARLSGVAILAALAFVAPVAARQAVDPSLLNPPPPDFFNATCFTGAGGVVCDMHFNDTPVAAEPSGVICDGTELLLSQDRSVVGKRYYDSNGNLVQRHFREDVSGTF